MTKILAVDDDIDIVTMIKEALSTRGYTMEVAYSGKECLQKVDSFKPDLILLDIMMPEMDGWEVLEELNRRGLTEKIKIAVLTASPLTDADINRKVFDQLVHYIRKPFEIFELFRHIDRIFEEESFIEEKSLELGESFGSNFTESYRNFSRKASRYQRIMSPEIFVRYTTGEVKDASEEEKMKYFARRIEWIEGELADLKKILTERLEGEKKN